MWLRAAVSKLAKALGPAELCVFEQATSAALRLNPHSPELAEWIAGVSLTLPQRK